MNAQEVFRCTTECYSDTPEVVRELDFLETNGHCLPHPLSFDLDDCSLSIDLPISPPRSNIMSNDNSECSTSDLVISQHIASFLNMIQSKADNIKLEAVSSLLYIVSMNHSDIAIRGGTVETLLSILPTASDAVYDESVKCIDKIIRSSTSNRDYVLGVGGISKLLGAIGTTKKKSSRDLVIRALSAFVEHDSRPQFSHVQADLPNLVRFLKQKEDPTIVVQCCNIITFLSKGSKDVVDSLCNYGAKEILLELFNYGDDESVVLAALRANKYLVPLKLTRSLDIITSPIMVPSVERISSSSSVAKGTLQDLTPELKQLKTATSSDVEANTPTKDALNISLSPVLLVTTPPKKRIASDANLEDYALSTSNNKKNKTMPITASCTNALLLPQDRKYVSEYTFLFMSNFRICVNSENGERGVECIHCADTSKPRKFYWSTPIRFANNCAEFPKHLLKCKLCPKEIKNQLESAKRTHDTEKKQLQRGSFIIFYRQIFGRIHSNVSILDSTCAVKDHGHFTFPVTLSSDSNILDERETFLRMNLEYFSLGDSELKNLSSYPMQDLQKGRIGVRCLHCSKFMPCHGTSTPGSFKLLTSLKDLRSDVLGMQKHFQACPYITKQCSQDLQKSISAPNKTEVLDYYANISRRVLVDGGKGFVTFKSNIFDTDTEMPSLSNSQSVQQDIHRKGQTFLFEEETSSKQSMNHSIDNSAPLVTPRNAEELIVSENGSFSI